jgi:hypothetical protein
LCLDQSAIFTRIIATSNANYVTVTFPQVNIWTMRFVGQALSGSAGYSF